MPNISITVKNKVARADKVIIVCDNSDYTAVFDFDAEWDEYTTKTARFVYGGRYTDVVFSGNECPVPVIQDTRAVTVGVFAGDLHTTTPAYFACVPSILFGGGVPADPTPDVYNQLMELLNKDSGVWYPAVDDAGNMSWTRSMSETEPQPVNIKGQKGDAGANGADGKNGISPAVSVAAITGGNRVTITDAEGAKTFDVMDGAQGASGADGKDYVLTDADKQEIAEAAAGFVDVPSVQPDWNQNDSTQPDYVKNRPFYTGDPVETVLVEESTVSFAAKDGMYMGQLESTFSATVGETYKVSWDGTVYECTCVSFENIPVIGNLSIMGAGSDTGEPFLMAVENGVKIEIYIADTSVSHTFSISDYAESVVKIDPKYLPVASETEPGIISITPLSNAILRQVKNKYFREHRTQVADYGDAATIEEYANINNGYGIFSSGKFGGAVLSCDKNAANKYITSVLSGGKNIECWKFSLGSTTMERLWGIFEDGVVISSSTANSTKKFKITVDDSGTITATEVS